jgi:hypothetical protein
VQNLTYQDVTDTNFQKNPVLPNGVIFALARQKYTSPYKARLGTERGTSI